MNDIYLTCDQAEEIIMAVEVGMYNIDIPGARSKLAHARLLMASQQSEPEIDLNMRSGEHCHEICLKKETE